MFLVAKILKSFLNDLSTVAKIFCSDDWEVPLELKAQHKVQLVALKGQMLQPVWYIPVGKVNFKGKFLKDCLHILDLEIRYFSIF